MSSMESRRDAKRAEKRRFLEDELSTWKEK
jgi:hypothetical protein